MKYQVLFSSKDKSKRFKCRLLQFLFGALRVNTVSFQLLRLSHTYKQMHVHTSWPKTVDIYLTSAVKI